MISGSSQSVAGSASAPDVVSPDSADVDRSRNSAWDRNLAALSVAQFLHAFGFSAAVPFISAFFVQDFNLIDRGQLATWAGLATSAQGVGVVIGSPAWGAVADRFGKKPMVLRALLMSGTWIGLVSISRGPGDVALLLLLQGLSGAAQTLAVSLVAAETPRARVGHAVGVIWSATAVGTVLGPISGSVTTSMFGFRGAFLVSAGVIFVASSIVLFAVHEVRTLSSNDEVQLRHIFRLSRATLIPFALLLAATTLAWAIGAAAPTLIALSLVSLAPGGAAPTIGVAVAALGLSAALSSIAHGRVRNRIGYRPTIVLACCVASLALVVLASADRPQTIVAGAAVIGLATGTLRPIVTSMVALQAQPTFRAMFIGLSGSAGACGTALGPLVGGSVAALGGISTAFMAALVAPAALGVLALFAIKEPDNREVLP